jgi:hypothetical protein
MEDTQLHVMDFLLDDNFALWDFADSFPEFRPDASSSRVNDLIELVAKGFVIVTFGKWFEQETVPLGYESAVAALLDPKAWQPTGTDPGHVLDLTENGFAHLRSLGIGTPKA